ncbi:tumor protein p63-regulated gene 1 protein-like isoform X5 [Rhineura floridana]|uniref:tumor protein p63-regulated gene 1 protein-like isoform X5 n=1 Tax=Rhineura floridana TaxID=261503 RepID=UPI002AC851DD|nr:tumor protein p63-regulated gene 1 protein-like isoform X5 [Rhineura floridana]
MTLRGLRWRQQGGGGGSSSSPSAAPACPLCCRRRRPPCTMIPPPPPPVHDDPLLLRRRRHLPERHQPAAVKMSGSGNYQEFQTVEMRKELEESNKENSDAGSASGPNSTTAPPSASKTMLYPRPYADPYDSRKYFATRPGAFDQAMDDLKAHVMSNMGETAHSFWLLADPHGNLDFCLGLASGASMPLTLQPPSN